MPLPTQDQVMAQLRVLIPAVGTIVSAVGIVSPDKVGTDVAMAMTAVGPIAYVIVAILVAHCKTRALQSWLRQQSPLRQGCRHRRLCSPPPKLT